MPDQLPIACSLDAPAFAQRERLIAALGADALLDARLEGTRATLRFAAGERVRARVEDFVAGESRCCAFLAMEVAAAGGDAVVLTIDAPPDAAPVLSELVALFGRGAAARA